MNIWMKLLEALLVGIINYGIIMGLMCLLIYPRLRRIEKMIKETRVIVNLKVRDKDEK